ncbi:ribosomal protection-like ABC-F family protein [Peribacillus deserti]|uniref:ABC transporter ATP-binding protein n=1 Tax=Peribacillus deserti TaxID=673318 RepID=A0A2N5M458_9BACI|nr:ABC-F type ribosomal protection protein [Peribacillus deserti]PLT29115.1 ABC transporter ATP-binding protein [Peribacillus deserti]
MRLLKAENLTVDINGLNIVQGGSLEIVQGEKVALLGRNGVGKTTFLRVLTGNLPHSKGSLSYGIDKSDIGWMMEEEVQQEQTALAFIQQGNAACDHLKSKLAEYNALWDLKGNDERFIDEYNTLLQDYADHGGYEWEAAVERILKEMKIGEALWNNPYSSLSGGQKTRLKLARLLIRQPKLLVLDEPTNHLDVESVEWLAAWLRGYRGTVLFISHEREFIDKVATVTYELTEKGTKRYPGGYSVYKKLKEEEIQAAKALYDKQQQERKKLLEVIQTYKQWYQKGSNAASVRDPYAQKQAGRHAVQIKSKEKALEKLENQRTEKPRETKEIRASFDIGEFDSKRMIALKDISFSYSHTSPFFIDISFHIQRGERIAVTGRNGSGKTTLLRLLTGQLPPDKGSLKKNPQTKIGYFMQELEGLKLENTILDEILSLKNITQEEARTILACFLFRREEVFKKVKDLSMGEKCRVAFVKLYFSEANLLVLDEPTNYLDISAREQIEEALLSYHGSVVIVSHDPYLLRSVANRVLYLNNGTIEDFQGTYEEWENYKKRTVDQQNLLNEQLVLELKLTDLLNQEESDMVQIRMIQNEINAIKKQL